MAPGREYTSNTRHVEPTVCVNSLHCSHYNSCWCSIIRDIETEAACACLHQATPAGLLQSSPRKSNPWQAHKNGLPGRVDNIDVVILHFVVCRDARALLLKQRAGRNGGVALQRRRNEQSVCVGGQEASKQRKHVQGAEPSFYYMRPCRNIADRYRKGPGDSVGWCAKSNRKQSGTRKHSTQTDEVLLSCLHPSPPGATRRTG